MKGCMGGDDPFVEPGKKLWSAMTIEGKMKERRVSAKGQESRKWGVGDN